LAPIVEMLNASGQELQLHLHPEWADEITPSPFGNILSKRQHLTYYSGEEQTRLIRYAMKTIQEAGGSRITAFRAGSFAANRETFAALAANQIAQDSSVNATLACSVPDLRCSIDLYRPSLIERVEEYPMSVFRDGLGRPRHAQLGACSAAEIIDAMQSARAKGWSHFVVLAHNFELLRPTSAEPDPIMVGRFKRVCEFLASNADELPTKGFHTVSRPAKGSTAHQFNLPTAHLAATARRHSEQLVRRLRG
jgi:hypothetical protein